MVIPIATGHHIVAVPRVDIVVTRKTGNLLAAHRAEEIVGTVRSDDRGSRDDVEPRRLQHRVLTIADAVADRHRAETVGVEHPTIRGGRQLAGRHRHITHRQGVPVGVGGARRRSAKLMVSVPQATMFSKLTGPATRGARLAIGV